MAAATEGLLPIRTPVQREEVRKVGSIISTKHSGLEMLSPTLRSQQMNIRCWGTATLKRNEEDE